LRQAAGVEFRELGHGEKKTLISNFINRTMINKTDSEKSWQIIGMNGWFHGITKIKTPVLRRYLQSQLIL
jgi:hypothetical protein